MTEQGHDEGKRATFSHFMREADDVVTAKDEYKQMLEHADYYDDDVRAVIIRHAQNMLNDEVHAIFSQSDTRAIRAAIASMQIFDDKIRAAVAAHMNIKLVEQNVSIFQSMAGEFLLRYSAAQFNSHLGFQTKRDSSEFDRFFAAIDVPKVIKNTYGIPVSPEMVTLAMGLCARTTRKWDNIIMIEGMPGVGKTSFTWALGTTMYDIYRAFWGIDRKWEPDKNVLVTETREYCNRLVSDLPGFTFLDFMEAGNQFSSKRFFDDEQQELVNTVERIRYHGLTLALEWNTVEGLDKTVRDRRATIVCSLEERGKAYIRGFNRNPAHRGLTKNPRTKDDLALTAEMASAILEQDALRLLTVPYYELPADIMKQADDRKDAGNKYLSSRKKAEHYYESFLINLPDNIIRITSEQLHDYAIANHQVLSMAKLAQIISEAIGLGKRSRLFQQTDIADATVGYIQVDDIIRSYIKHLRAELQGAVQYKQERDKDGSA